MTAYQVYIKSHVRMCVCDPVNVFMSVCVCGCIFVRVCICICVFLFLSIFVCDFGLSLLVSMFMLSFMFVSVHIRACTKRTYPTDDYHLK